MNKKFLSAILFGALMVTSTGTFVSCKDYDDDIDEINAELTDIKSQIAALQTQISAGKWITSASSTADGVTITLSDGQTLGIANGKDGAQGEPGADGKDGSVVEVKEGVLYIDGVATEIKVAEEAPATPTTPAVKVEGGELYVLQADGTYAATGITTATVTATKANGIWTLTIKNADGSVDTVTLPATCDSYTVEAPYKEVRVKYETAKWTKWDSSSDAAKTLLKAFPELADIEKNTVMKQGGMLPLIVSPSAVELTNDYKFSLQTTDGETANITLKNPVKGLVDNTIQNGANTYGYDTNGDGVDDWFDVVPYDYMETRAASDDCHWGLVVEPAYNEKTKTYAQANIASLVVENESGVVSKTAFAYSVASESVENNVYIESNINFVNYAPAIDVFAPVNEYNYRLLNLGNEYVGYYVLELTNAVQVEKYGLSVDGSKILIGNMPANETSITVSVKLTAVGLNGSVASMPKNIYVSQSVGAEAALSDKEVTLSGDVQKVRWDISELNMSAVQLHNFINGNETIKASYEADKNEDGTIETYVAYNAAIKYYNAKGQEVNYNSYSSTWYVAATGAQSAAATTFGFDVDATTLATNANEMWMPEVYTISVTSTNGSAVIYSAEAKLTVSNPTASYIKLVPAFVENDVFQITGVPASGFVTYDLSEAVILSKNAALKKFIDLDYNDKVTDNTLTSYYNWVSSDGATLSVNQWQYVTDKPTTWNEAYDNQLYKERNIRAVYTLFGNTANEVYFDFKVQVKSELYSEDGTQAITIDATKLSAIFGKDNASTTDVVENQINISSAITKAVVMAGTDKGKTYKLFATAGSSTPTTVTTYDFSAPKTAGGYVLGTDGNLVAMTVVDYLTLVPVEDDQDKDVVSGQKVYNMKEADWSPIWAVAKKYYTTDGKAIYKMNGDEVVKDADGNAIWNATDTKDIAEADEAAVSLFNKYKSTVAFASTTSAGTPNVTAGTSRDARIAWIKVTFDDAAEAAKYFKGVDTTENGYVYYNADGAATDPIKLTAMENAPSDVTGGKVTVAMTLTIRDVWGMIMTVPFEVTVKTSNN